jgi:rSAM/selenodomain-associated transferase 1
MTGESGRRLVLFAKEPEAGRVKTRLARTIGAEAAAALYEAFLVDLSTALSGDWDAVVAHDGNGGSRLLKIFSEGWTQEPQGVGSLGERMARAVTKGFTGDSSKVVLAGSDAPALTAEDIAGAFKALDASEIVFAPSPDGGYSLVGVRRNDEKSTAGDSSKVFLEKIRWSTAYALEDTEAAARGAGLSMARLAPVPDVDVEEDLEILRAALASNASIAPATRAAIRRMCRPALLPSKQKKNLSGVLN